MEQKEKDYSVIIFLSIIFFLMIVAIGVAIAILPFVLDMFPDEKGKKEEQQRLEKQRREVLAQRKTREEALKETTKESLTEKPGKTKTPKQKTVRKLSSSTRKNAKKHLPEKNARIQPEKEKTPAVKVTKVQPKKEKTPAVKVTKVQPGKAKTSTVKPSRLSKPLLKSVKKKQPAHVKKSVDVVKTNVLKTDKTAKKKVPVPAVKSTAISSDDYHKKLKDYLKGKIVSFDPKTLEIELKYDFAEKNQLEDWEPIDYLNEGQKAIITREMLIVESAKGHGGWACKPHFTELEVDFFGMFTKRDIIEMLINKSYRREHTLTYICSGWNDGKTDVFVRNWRLPSQTFKTCGRSKILPGKNVKGKLIWKKMRTYFTLNEIKNKWPTIIFAYKTAQFGIAVFRSKNYYYGINIKGKLDREWFEADVLKLKPTVSKRRLKYRRRRRQTTKYQQIKPKTAVAAPKKTTKPASGSGTGKVFGIKDTEVKLKLKLNHNCQVWKILPPYAGNKRYRVSIKHALPGKKGGFYYTAWADTDKDNKPDKLISRSKKFFTTDKAGEWTQWEFSTENKNVFVGNCWKRRGIHYYTNSRRFPGYLGLDNKLFYSRTYGKPPAKSTIPRYINIKVEALD